MDPPVPIPAVVRFEDLRDRRFEFLFRVRGLEAGLVIKERRAGQARDLQQDREWVVSLEGNDGLDLQRRS
jgi:hypothetical protein